MQYISPMPGNGLSSRKGTLMLAAWVTAVVTVQDQSLGDWFDAFWHRLTSDPLRLGLALGIAAIAAAVLLYKGKRPWNFILMIPTFLGGFWIVWSGYNLFYRIFKEGQHQEPIFTGRFAGLTSGWAVFGVIASLAAAVVTGTYLKAKKGKEIGGLARLFLMVFVAAGGIALTILGVTIWGS